METSNMTLHLIRDLVGTDVAGRMADLRTRNADGTLRYAFTENENRIAPLKRVYIKHKNDGDWLRWEWDSTGAAMPFACGFSGIRLDRDDAEEFHILVAD